MIKFLKILLLAFVISALMSVGVFAASFDDLKAQAVSTGVVSSVIGGENELVKSENAEAFLKEYTSAELEFSGEYVSTAEYLTAILGIMGYSAENGDFLAEFPYDKAAQVGVLTSLPKNSANLTNRMMLEYAFAAKNSSSVFSDMPEISENGSIVGLTNFYDPSISENIVDMFNGELLGLEVTDTNKFNVSVVQGAGIYKTDVKQIESVTLSNAMQLKKGSYFSAYAFSGAELTVNVCLNSDIYSMFEVYSTKPTYSAEFSDGVVSIRVSEPQTLKVVFDGSAENSVTVFVGKKGVDTLESAGSAVIAEVNGNRVSADASKVCPGKMVINNSVVYYPVIVKNSKAYISEQLYVGDYTGEDALTVDGDIYIPVSKFVGNGNIESADYDSVRGLISITKKSDGESVELGKFAAFEENSTNVIDSGDKIIIEFADENSFVGGFASIDIGALSSFKCLRLTSNILIEGRTEGLLLDLLVLGYNDRGVTEIISKSSARAFSKAYDTTVYFDFSNLNGAYEEYYFVIGAEGVADVKLTLQGTNISVFEISSEMGDNEFNPF